jgi:putative SOS response-associated peptidase YedK
MCNLYSLTKGQAAIRGWFRASHDRTGNLPLFPGIFPDQMAPIVRNGADGERELVMARWGMPGPQQFGGAPITNIRNVGSPHWRGWLGKQNRCIVPALLFASTPTPSRARRRNGSRSARTDRCSGSLVYGPLGAVCEDRRARQLTVSMNCSASSRRNRMPPSPQFIRRRCPSF